MVRRAARWAARLDGDSVSGADRRACDSWCAEHPLHEVALSRMQALGDRFEALDPAARRAIASGVGGATSAKWPARLSAAAAVAACIVGSWTLSQSLGFRALAPDVKTQVGELRPIHLADGSTLIADTATRLDSYAAGAVRDVILFDGRVMATVAPSGSTFTVRTAEGWATALGTRYSVERDGDVTRVTVVESRVQLCPKSGDCRILDAGEQAEMTRDGVGPTRRIDPERAALWVSGWTEADNLPLPALIDELARYSAAPIHYNGATLADLRVTGSYPLTNPEASLRAVAGTLGLRLEMSADGALALSR